MLAMIQDHNNFAVYSPAEAARLIGISNQKVRRWTGGYSARSGDTVRDHPALWHRRYEDVDGFYLGFQDLIEVRFVNAFVNAGLAPQAVRNLLKKASEIFGGNYPLSSEKFRTDGKTIFLEIWEQETKRTIDVKNGQHAFRSIIKPSFKDLEFENNVVSKWYVDGRRKSIEIDPNIAFGQPVVKDTTIPTARIFETFIAEGGQKKVAQLFEIPVIYVKHAIAFEQELNGLN